MNTTNNKTSLYDLVTKNDKINAKGEDVKNKLNTIPRGEILTAYNQFGEVVNIFIYNSKAIGSDYFNTLLTCYPYAGQITKDSTLNLNDIDRLDFATSKQKVVLFEQMKKEGYIWDGQNVLKELKNKEDSTKEEEMNSDNVKKTDKIEDDNKINLSKLKTLMRGEILTAYNELGQIVDILVYDRMLTEDGLINTVVSYSPMNGELRDSPVLDFDNLAKLTFSTPEEKDTLRKIMKKEGYQNDWWGWEDEEETEEEESVDDEIIDESPTEENPSTNGDKNIIDKAIENKIAHNIKVAKDILDNTLPYYAINDNIERVERIPDIFLERDLNNFNYFTNKEDVDEAIRRVKETLMNFQEEIQNRNK